MAEHTKTLARRDLFKTSLVSGLAGLVGLRSSWADVREACGITPAQTEGPFYPENDQPDENNDLTVVQGTAGRPKGQYVVIEGRVTDDQCRPVKNALVEIWQAAASGRYNHRLDTSGLELDRNFQYWGESITDSEGRYAFKTVIPGDYPASADWRRPPHIHLKVEALGHHELISQMYFDPRSFADPSVSARIKVLNDRDRILRAVPTTERDRVIVEFKKVVAGTKVLNLVVQEGELIGKFDIAVRRA